METSAEIAFAQRLASNEKTIRDRALKKLRKYISARASKTGKRSPQCTRNVLTLDIVTNCGTTTTVNLYNLILNLLNVSFIIVLAKLQTKPKLRLFLLFCLFCFCVCIGVVICACACDDNYALVSFRLHVDEQYSCPWSL